MVKVRMHDETQIEISKWSKSFQRLFSIFSKINTHLTFLSSHSRTTIPTFDLIKKLIPDVREIDLSIIVHLLPYGEGVFEYVDENQVMLSFAEKDFNWGTGYKQSQPQTISDVYEEISELERTRQPSKQLLIFDFKDAKFQGIGSASKRKRPKIDPDSNQSFFLSSKELSTQNLSQVQLKNMISSRNRKFKGILENFLKNYTFEDRENDLPMKDLERINEPNIPQPPEWIDPMDMVSPKKKVALISGQKVAPSVEDMIRALKIKPFYKDQLVATRTLTSRSDGKFKALRDTNSIIHPEIKTALLKYKGIDIDTGLYSHQAEALDALLFDSKSKNHVIVSTSTSSGKSLIYQLPILNEILWDIETGIKKRSSTAFFIFPTKALAQDQKRHLQSFIDYLPSNLNRKIIVEAYDGDTNFSSRNFVRSYADIIITNPDAIHASILPNHDKYYNSTGWQDFLQCLKYVVMDELHVYKGTFGVHVSFVMSRLMRLISKFHNDQAPIQFISCSATISNPPSHFRAVCAIHSSEKIVHIFEDGSPCSEKQLICWRPPPLMNKRGETQRRISKINTENEINALLVPRVSIIQESANVLLQLLTNFPNIKVIVFCPIRQICELMMKEIRNLIRAQSFKNKTDLLESDIMSYRGGYSKSDRRIIENKMFNGKLRAIIATNALELGIDLSDLDVVISCGFPISKSNLHQQFGRAGRSKESKGSLAIYIAGQTPVDHHYLNNVSELCDKNNYEDLCVEGLIDLSSNQLIMEMHLQCSAFEWPIDLEVDTKWFVPDNSILKKNTFIKLCKEKLYCDNNGKYRTNPKYLPWPVEGVSIRAVEEVNFAVVDITNNRNIVIEEVAASRTSFTLYEGGIFLHQGYPYLVKEFNPEGLFAKVQRVEVDWITQQRDFTDIDPIEIEYIKQLQLPWSEPSDIPVFFGKIEITIIVFGFFKVNRRSEILEAVEVKNPPITLKSKGFWVDIPNQALNIIKGKSLSPAGGIHAAQHAIMNILPLFINGGATTNPNAKFSSNIGEAELQTECKAPQKEFAQRQTRRKRPARLIFHDSKGGAQGTGIAAKTFEHIDEIIFAAFMRIKKCDCEWGCPECVAASFCKEMSMVMSKPAAIIILAALLGMDLNKVKEEVSDGPEKNMPQIMTETVETVRHHTKMAPDVQIIEVKNIEKSLPKVANVENVESGKSDGLVINRMTHKDSFNKTIIKSEEI